MLANALHQGCRENDLLLVSMILDQQVANVNAKDKQGRTALHLAVTDNNNLMTKVLLQHGADTSVVADSGDDIPLDCAKDDDMVMLLAIKMAKDGKDDLLRETLKHINNPEKVKPTFNKELQTFPPEKRILPPLTGLISKPKISFTNSLDMVECDSQRSSLSNVSDRSTSSICDSGYMGMDIGSSDNDFESNDSFTTDCYVRKGNGTLAKQRRVTSPLTQQEFNAIDSNRNRRFADEPKNLTNIKVRRKTHPTRSASILSHKNPKSKTTKHVSFPSDVLLDTAILDDEFVEACHLIKSTKIDINRPAPNGLTPLHRAAIEGSYDCLQLLVDQGAIVNITDEHGWTPLHDAVYHSNMNCVTALLKAGANVSLLTEDMHTVLELAATQHMLFTVGRALILYELGFVADIGEDIKVNIPKDPNRESCV